MKKLTALLLSLILSLSLTVPCFAAPPHTDTPADYGIELCDYGEDVNPPPKDGGFHDF